MLVSILAVMGAIRFLKISRDNPSLLVFRWDGQLVVIVSSGCMVFLEDKNRWVIYYSGIHVWHWLIFFKTHLILSVVTQVLTTHAGVNPAEVNGIEIQPLRNLLLILILFYYILLRWPKSFEEKFGVICIHCRPFLSFFVLRMKRDGLLPPALLLKRDFLKILKAKGEKRRNNFFAYSSTMYMASLPLAVLGCPAINRVSN